MFEPALARPFGRLAFPLAAVCLIAGCLSPDVEGGTVASAIQEGPVHPAVTTPIHWTGSIRTSACVPAGPEACTGASHGPDGQTRLSKLDADVHSFRLTLYWNATTPSLTELGFSISKATPKECGEDCEGWKYERLAKSQGPSPLLLGVQGVELTEGDQVRLHVYPLRQTPEPVYGYAYLQQSFHATGSLNPR